MLALLGAGGSALLGSSCTRTPVRHGALRMQAGMLPTGGSELEANNEQGNTFWATLDGRDRMVKVSPGSFPLGSAPARLLRLLRARLTALGRSVLPGRGHELATSAVADSTAFAPAGVTRKASRRTAWCLPATT